MKYFLHKVQLQVSTLDNGHLQVVAFLFGFKEIGWEP